MAFEEEHNRDHEIAQCRCARCAQAADAAITCSLCGAPNAELAFECSSCGASFIAPPPSPCERFAHLKNPFYNLKLACEELTLLEQHLLDPEFRCPECIRKHFLYVQGILRECLRLDEHGYLSSWVNPMTDALHLCGMRWAEGWDPAMIGQLIRRVRARTSNRFNVV